MMELPCESVRYLEERRPKSSKLVELHVLYVPDDQWDRKLNKVPAEAIESFISAGFIRVYPDMTLETLRGELGISLGADIRADRLSFLKCVGRSLAVVKHEQERDLKVKTFAPPYAAQPELYLLPVGQKGSRHSPPTPSAADEEEQRGEEDEEEEEEEGDEEEEVVGEVEEDSCCSTEGENDGEGGSSLKADWTEDRSQKRRCKTLMRSSHDTQSQGEKYIPLIRSASDMGCISLSEGDELIEEIKLVREERKQLEWTRQELLRKGKDLLAQNRNRRNQARDSWKKKYFETKKAAAPLEETLRNLRQELETFYNKLLHQLQARDGRGRARHQGRSSTKNEFIIQIMTESHEIDNLRRQVEDAKMKLITEIRLRKQAATELRALKAELAQKKSQSSHTGPMTSQPFGPIPRNRPFAQKTGS
ncbi:unnamed protein product [Merluccius merluccius]